MIEDEWEDVRRFVVDYGRIGDWIGGGSHDGSNIRCKMRVIGGPKMNEGGGSVHGCR